MKTTASPPASSPPPSLGSAPSLLRVAVFGDSLTNGWINNTCPETFPYAAHLPELLGQLNHKRRSSNAALTTTDDHQSPPSAAVASSTPSNPIPNLHPLPLFDATTVLNISKGGIRVPELKSRIRRHFLPPDDDDDIDALLVRPPPPPSTTATNVIPDVAVVLMGTNDLSRYPVSSVKEDLRSFYEFLTNTVGIPRLILVTVPPVGKRLGLLCGPEVVANRIELNHWIVAHAAERGWPVVDLFREVAHPFWDSYQCAPELWKATSPLSIPDDAYRRCVMERCLAYEPIAADDDFGGGPPPLFLKEEYDGDGLHLTPLGYRRFAELVAIALAAALR